VTVYSFPSCLHRGKWKTFGIVILLCLLINICIYCQREHNFQNTIYPNVIYYFFGLVWSSLTTNIEKNTLVFFFMYLLHLHDEGQKHLKEGNWTYRVLNVVFTLTINGHNGKVKQSAIFLLPPYPTVSYNHPVETCCKKSLAGLYSTQCLAGSDLCSTKWPSTSLQSSEKCLSTGK